MTVHPSSHVTKPQRRLCKKTSLKPSSKPLVINSTGEVSLQLSTVARLANTENQPPNKQFIIKERHPDYVVVQSAFDRETLLDIQQFLKRKRPRAARMKNEGGDSDDERKARYDDRDCAVSWFSASMECPWRHKRLAEIVRLVGNAEWPLLKVGMHGQLLCEYEQTQYAVYGANQHFRAWHQDAYAQGHDPEDARQLTLVVMLSERSAYTGGTFDAKVPGPSGRKRIRKIDLHAGDVVVFPAKQLEHRVSVVKSGVRKSLVFWACDKASCKYYTGEHV